MIEITLGRGINLPPQFPSILITKDSNINTYIHTHLHHAQPNLLLRKLNIGNKLISHFNQGLLGPIGKPIQRRTINQGRELPTSNS